MQTDEVSYDPNDPDDPLRHQYLKRAKRSDFAVPIAEKVAAGLGVAVPKGFGEVHAEQVPRTLRERVKRVAKRS